jgi:hypothetical protein
VQTRLERNKRKEKRDKGETGIVKQGASLDWHLKYSSSQGSFNPESCLVTSFIIYPTTTPISFLGLTMVSFFVCFSLSLSSDVLRPRPLAFNQPLLSSWSSVELPHFSVLTKSALTWLWLKGQKMDRQGRRGGKTKWDNSSKERWKEDG